MQSVWTQLSIVPLPPVSEPLPTNDDVIDTHRIAAQPWARVGERVGETNDQRVDRHVEVRIRHLDEIAACRWQGVIDGEHDLFA